MCSGARSCDDRGDCINSDKCRCKPSNDRSLPGCKTCELWTVIANALYTSYCLLYFIVTCKDDLCGKHGHCTGPNRCRCEDGYQFTTTCESKIFKKIVDHSYNKS